MSIQKPVFLGLFALAFAFGAAFAMASVRSPENEGKSPVSTAVKSVTERAICPTCKATKGTLSLGCIPAGVAVTNTSKVENGQCASEDCLAKNCKAKLQIKVVNNSGAPFTYTPIFDGATADNPQTIPSDGMPYVWPGVGSYNDRDVICDVDTNHSGLLSIVTAIGSCDATFTCAKCL